MIVRVTNAKFGPMVKELNRVNAKFNASIKTWDVDDFWAGKFEFAFSQGWLIKITAEEAAAPAVNKALTGDREFSVRYVNGQRIEGVW